MKQSKMYIQKRSNHATNQLTDSTLKMQLIMLLKHKYKISRCFISMIIQRKHTNTTII